MCNCLAHVSQEISSFNKNEDKDELYTLIHCSPEDLKNFDGQKKKENNSVSV